MKWVVLALTYAQKYSNLKFQEFVIISQFECLNWHCVSLEQHEHITLGIVVFVFVALMLDVYTFVLYFGCGLAFSCIIRHSYTKEPRMKKEVTHSAIYVFYSAWAWHCRFYKFKLSIIKWGFFFFSNHVLT